MVSQSSTLPRSCARGSRTARHREYSNDGTALIVARRTSRVVRASMAACTTSRWLQRLHGPEISQPTSTTRALMLVAARCARCWHEHHPSRAWPQPTTRARGDDCLWCAVQRCGDLRSLIAHPYGVGRRGHILLHLLLGEHPLLPSPCHSYETASASRQLSKPHLQTVALVGTALSIGFYSAQPQISLRHLSSGTPQHYAARLC